MFSPSTKKLGLSSTPVTPLAENRKSIYGSSIPHRPSTGTPAPWASRLSVLARIPPGRRSGKGDELDPVKPVYVGEFPQVVRDEQTSFLKKHAPGDYCVSGGMDKGTCLSWIIFGNKLFMWSHLSPAVSKRCIVLEIPSYVLEMDDTSKCYSHSNWWLLGVVNWDGRPKRAEKRVTQCNSAGVVLCNQISRAVVYWPEIYSVGTASVSTVPHDELEVLFSPCHVGVGSASVESIAINSLIVSDVSKDGHVSIALACSSNGELWLFHCTPGKIDRKKVDGQFPGHSGYPRSLAWQFLYHSMVESDRQFLVLTNHDIQCFEIKISPDLIASKIWSHEIIGSDGQLGIDVATQKKIWPLDMQIDKFGKVITILVATYCKDSMSSSSYTQYSLLTMQYGSNMSMEVVESNHEAISETESLVQVIIPKARVEEKHYLFSMRLRVGGKPSGSVILLSDDGTATVFVCNRNSPQLYKFDLPYDGGKVLDASVIPSTEDVDDGAWLILTEKAGVWAIPEKAVLLGDVEPTDQSLSHTRSPSERSTREECRNLTPVRSIALRTGSLEAWVSGDRQREALTEITGLAAEDEESESLIGHLFHDFMISGQVNSSYGKLQKSGAFGRDGEANVFVRASKSIVDTLAKHWTTTRGADIVALAVVSSQLKDKQQKHQRFLQFLALSECHEELCLRQRYSMQIIMEHREKLAGMIQLRELQNLISQNRSTEVSTQQRVGSGSLWDLIQLVGEQARRNTVLLMDRDNAEVFYTKVSDLQKIFYFLEEELGYLINSELPFKAQTERACELSKACVAIIRTAMHYKNENYTWYPPSEGLTAWYCQLAVCNGMWSVASFMLQMLNEAAGLDISLKSDLYSHLEGLGEVLLEAYAGAITAKVERGEEHKSLLNDYWRRRDILLETLYHQAKSFAEASYQDMREEINGQKEELLRKLRSGLLPIAKRHESYLTLWSICCDLADPILLRNLMHESMGPKGGFSHFVFKQLYDSRQFSKLLRLGEEFPEDLCFFLKKHRELLWLHELFLDLFSLGSETLHALALCQDDCSISAAEEGTESKNMTSETPLADRKHFLNLSKIAALAGKSADYQAKVRRIEADLKLLNLQEAIMNLIPEEHNTRLLPPDELINLCLKSKKPELVLVAFDVFSWTSNSFRKSNRILLEECWKNAAEADGWDELYQVSMRESWSDDGTLRVLCKTMLFQASRRCYGPEAETYEGGFEEVLPLREENPENPVFGDSTSSVELILMHHRYFPDAGRLMLTAITLGSARFNSSSEDDPSPME